jgi:predicted nucleotide-binding protein
MLANVGLQEAWSRANNLISDLFRLEKRMAKRTNEEPVNAAKMRTYVSQSDIPAVSLEKAIKIPAAIGDNYGYKPASPLQVAKALDVQPTTGHFKRLTGAAIAYGLTLGGYNADTISITPLGLRIVRPTIENDDLVAKREAILKPRVTREFLQRYANAPLPKDSIAHNVLMEMGVPLERTAEVFRMIVDSATAVGFIVNIKDRLHVDLSGMTLPPSSPLVPDVESDDAYIDDAVTTPPQSSTARPSLVAPFSVDSRARRVFIAHGKNQAVIEPVKKLLGFSELEAVVSVQTQTVSQPVPGKVMEGMRSCGAAVIHIDDERSGADTDAPQTVNANVLIEIGAAMALYGQRFILIVRDGMKLPSNLQGLLELRYKGDTLNMEETVKLMEAISDMKQRPLPQPVGN